MKTLQGMSKDGGTARRGNRGTGFVQDELMGDIKGRVDYRCCMITLADRMVGGICWCVVAGCRIDTRWREALMAVQERI